MSYDSGIDIPKQKTAIRQAIELLEYYNETQRLSAVEERQVEILIKLVKTKEAVNEQQIIDACNIGNQKPRGLFDGGEYFEETFENNDKY